MAYYLTLRHALNSTSLGIRFTSQPDGEMCVGKYFINNVRRRRHNFFYWNIKQPFSHHQHIVDGCLANEWNHGPSNDKIQFVAHLRTSKQKQYWWRRALFSLRCAGTFWPVCELVWLSDYWATATESEKRQIPQQMQNELEIKQNGRWFLINNSKRLHYKCQRVLLHLPNWWEFMITFGRYRCATKRDACASVNNRLTFGHYIVAAAQYSRAVDCESAVTIVILWGPTGICDKSTIAETILGIGITFLDNCWRHNVLCASLILFDYFIVWCVFAWQPQWLLRKKIDNNALYILIETLYGSAVFFRPTQQMQCWPASMNEAL